MSEEIKNEDELVINYKLRLIIILMLIIISFILFHYGSWKLLWGDFLINSNGKDFILDDNSIAFKLDGYYYGFYRDTVFFNSAFLQIFMLSSAITTSYYSLKNIFKLIF